MIDQKKFDDIKLLSQPLKARYKNKNGDIFIIDIKYIDFKKNCSVKYYITLQDSSDIWVEEKDIQILTPVKFNDEYIGIGDTICAASYTEEYIVYDYIWHDGFYHVCCVRSSGNLNESCYRTKEHEITNHVVDAGFSTNVGEMTLEEVCKELGRTIKIVKSK